MSIKELSKYDRYLRVLEVCKGKVLPCDIISDLVYIGVKSILLDTRILTKFGYLKETQFKVLKLGRPTKHYTTLIDKLEFEAFESMIKESAAYWSKAKRFRPELYKTQPKKPSEIPQIEQGNFTPLYQLLGLYPRSEIKPLPIELITVYDINQNKEKVNETIRMDFKKSPRNYPGTSAGMVW
jgi:hypothetical protein